MVLQIDSWFCVPSCLLIVLSYHKQGLLLTYQTFSSYKHHNSIKVLIGITPQGSISFVSEAWGGRTSDKNLTENCGFLEFLVPGNMVM